MRVVKGMLGVFNPLFLYFTVFSVILSVIFHDFARLWLFSDAVFLVFSGFLLGVMLKMLYNTGFFKRKRKKAFFSWVLLKGYY